MFSPHAVSSYHTQPLPGPQKRASGSTLALVGSPSLHKQLSSIHSLPSKQWVSGNTEQGKPKRVLSASGRRAKQGFRYWPEDVKVTPQSMYLAILVSSVDVLHFTVHFLQVVRTHWDPEVHS